MVDQMVDAVRVFACTVNKAPPSFVARVCTRMWYKIDIELYPGINKH